MKALLLLALWALSSSIALAQDAPVAKCPSITVTGPSGTVGRGELATYTADVSNAEQYPLEYIWTISSGRIKDGQGTRSIRVIQPESCLTVNVEIKGLPTDCPVTASETGCGLPAPAPIRIYQLLPSKLFSKAAARSIASVMLENPNNQLYILAGDVGRKNSPAFQQKQRTIIDLLSGLGVTRDRITLASVYSDVELFEFWRVPPGASNPKCEECDELDQVRSDCPTISVTGPATVTEPGDLMKFTGNVAGQVPAGVTYRWSLAGEGEIFDGQGSLRLRVRTPRKSPFTVIATLEILGLPSGCTNAATEAAPVAS